jgi:hypothetical protein
MVKDKDAENDSGEEVEGRRPGIFTSFSRAHIFKNRHENYHSLYATLFNVFYFIFKRGIRRSQKLRYLFWLACRRIYFLLFSNP